MATTQFWIRWGPNPMKKLVKKSKSSKKPWRTPSLRKIDQSRMATKFKIPILTKITNCSSSMHGHHWKTKGFQLLSSNLSAVTCSFLLKRSKPVFKIPKNESNFLKLSFITFWSTLKRLATFKLMKKNLTQLSEKRTGSRRKWENSECWKNWRKISV